VSFEFPCHSPKSYSKLITMRCDVLHWLLPRKQILAYLTHDPNIFELDGGTDFKSEEVTMLLAIARDDTVGCKFWACCFTIAPIATWGAKISSFFHSCPVHGFLWPKKSCKDCIWKGRMAVVLARGDWLVTFKAELINLDMGLADDYLRRCDAAYSRQMMEDFNNCRFAMAQRMDQSFGFWLEIPWTSCAIAAPLFCSDTTSDAFLSEVRYSKQHAAKCVHDFDRGLARDRNLTNMNRFLYDSTFPDNLNLRRAVNDWITNDCVTMFPVLATELLGYCSAQTVIQLLEAVHHLVNQRQGYARAGLPASLSSSLRRRQNDDLSQTLFRENLGRYLSSLDTLLPGSFDSRSDLIRNVYGFSLESMHGDADDVAEQLNAVKTTARSLVIPRPLAICDKEVSVRRQHIMDTLVTHKTLV
jgi:hypothetical protein